ncbi:MAG: hypothetical protein HGB08_01715 [Candidatus Moranbacteria bacterium]|nr:hypothetical protein [Candidatus Moranbacteria bacterium]
MNQSQSNLWKSVFGEWRRIAFSVLLVSSLVFFISTIIPPKYKSETQILILQKNMDANAYQAAKSSEFAGEVLKRVIGSSDFMNGVLASTGENSRKFGDTPELQIKGWDDAVDVSTMVNTGIINISAYDTSRLENKKMTEAIINELQTSGSKYHGNDNITLKKIGGPVYYDNPAYPIIWLNVLISAVLAFFVSIGVIMLKKNKEEKQRLYFGKTGGHFVLGRNDFEN